MHAEQPDTLRGPDRIGAAVVAAVVGLLVLAIGWRSAWVVQTQSYDLLLYGRSLWGVATGHLFNPVYGTPVFGVHANLVLLALTPFAWLLEPAAVLIVAQAGSLAVSLWLVGREAPARRATLLVLLVALSPLLHNPFTFDARPDLIGVPLLLGALLRMRARGAVDVVTIALLAGATACREEWGFVAAAAIMTAPWTTATLAAAWRRTALASAYAAWPAIYMVVLRPAIGAGDRAERATSELLSFGWGGWDYRAAVVVALLAVGGGVWLRGWRWAGAAIPGVLLVLAIDKFGIDALRFHYAMFALPGLLAACVDGVQRGALERPGRTAVAGIAMALTFTAFGTLPPGRLFARDFVVGSPEQNRVLAEARAAIERIPAEAGQVVPYMIAAHVADRPEVWTIEPFVALMQREQRVPDAIDHVALIESQWDRVGRYLSSRAGFSATDASGGLVVLSRSGTREVDLGPVAAQLGVFTTTAPCGHPERAWPTLSACVVGDGPSGVEVRITVHGQSATPVALLMAGPEGPQPVTVARGLVSLAAPAMIPPGQALMGTVAAPPGSVGELVLIGLDGAPIPPLMP